MSQGYKVPIPYGPNGCQVHIGSQACRETQTLEIIKEFKRVYESKMSELNSAGGGDNVMAKVQLQQDWIRDLTQQNEMLVRAVEELEKEAADRVSMLERRLQTSAQVSQDTTKLNTKLQEMETRLSQSPKQSDVEELNHKIRLKDEELDSAKRKFEEHCVNTEHQINCRDRYIKDLMQQISIFKEQYAHKDKREYSVENSVNKDTLIHELKKEIQSLKDRITKLERVKSPLSIAPRHRSSSTPSSPRVRSRSPKRKILAKIDKSLSPILQSGKLSGSPRTSKATSLRYTCVPSKRTENADKVSPQRYGCCSCSKTNQDKTVCCRKVSSRRSRSAPTSDSLDDSVENAELDSFTKHQKVFHNNPFNLPRAYLYNDLLRKGFGNLKGTFLQKNALEGPTDKNSLCGGDSVGTFVKKKNSICTLTANKILHEYYGLSNRNRGVVHNFQEVSAKINLVTIPKRVPIKTYINNLELNIKKGRDNHDFAKKKIQSPRK